MLQVDLDSKKSLYQQIYEQIKQDILSEKIPVGSRLTSTRALAKELQVGRNTVENAYAQLVLEGYITSVAGSGFVVNHLQFDLYPKRNRTQLKEKETMKKTNHVESVRYNFEYGDLHAMYFPTQIWKKIVSEVLEGKDAQEVHSYGEGKGDKELRTQLKEYLYHSRGVRCQTKQIIICSGTQSAIEILMKILPYNKKQIAMEEPGYNGVRTLFDKNGFEILPIPVYEDGIGIEKLSLTKARMVYVAPSHQFPMGVVMPIQKRMELLNWAKAGENLIIEDDYDSEFRYQGRPLPSLQSIDEEERVVYIGTFSKVLSPGLRMAYMVLPNWLLPKYEKRFDGQHCNVSFIEQKIIAKLIAEGHWEKHVRKICLLHKKKHDILVHAIKKYMGERVKIHGHHAGLHILLEFLDGQKEEVLVKVAREHHIKVSPVSPSWLNETENKRNAIILGYGMMLEEDIDTAVELLAKIWFDY